MKFLNTIHQYDVSMFTWLNINIGASLINTARFISKTADGYLYLLLAVVLWTYQGLHSLLLQTMLLAFAIERTLYFVLKNSFRRNRPAAALENFVSVIVPADQFSFPSGHTSAAFMMTTLIHYFLQPVTDMGLLCLSVLYVWAVSVAFSRIMLGVHFPTDTLMGAGLGTGTALFSIEVLGL